MAVKIFLTGVTGYIGGDAFYLLQQNHPDFEFTLLVRSEDKAKNVLAKYPAVRVVIGGLDDSELIEREAAAADIVLGMFIVYHSHPKDALTSIKHRRLLRPREERTRHCKGSCTRAYAREARILAPHRGYGYPDVF